MPEGAPDRLVKIAPQRVVTQELDREPGAADKRSQDPGKLAPEEKIAA